MAISYKGSEQILLGQLATHHMIFTHLIRQWFILSQVPYYVDSKYLGCRAINN